MFASNRATRNEPDLFTVPASGGELKAITSGPDLDRDPTFSPDGLRVLFARFPPPADWTSSNPKDPTLYAVDTDGSNLTPRGGSRWSARRRCASSPSIAAGSGVRRVELAVSRGALRGRCRWLGGTRFGTARSCDRPTWRRIASDRAWRGRLSRLPSGTYRLRFRTSDRGAKRTVQRELAVRLRP